MVAVKGDIPVKVWIGNSEGNLPSYQKPGDSGADITSTEEVYILPGTWATVGTGLHIELPEGYEAQVRPRSGWASKFGITVLNTPGTVDSCYRGEVKVILANFGKLPFEVKKGDRIAQLVICPVHRAQFTQVGTREELEDTVRGDGGFGHTGS